MSAKNVLKIRLLGELELLRGGEPLALPQSRKTRGLLAYLVATSRTHRRDRLCSLFWDVPDDPRGALRWSLSKLRPLVDEHDRKRIVADRESVTFDTIEADVDLLAVQEHLAGGIETVSARQLEDLAKTFRGEFLEGLELPNCPDFQAWCAAEREEAHRLQVDILRALIERLSPEAEAALPYARVLTRLDPYDENSRARLVQLLAATGRRREAEQQYDLGKQVLKEISGAQSDVLERAWQEVREGGAKPPRGDRADPVRPSPPAQADRGSDDLTAAEAFALQGETLPLPAEPSIVVLPLENGGDDTDQDYFPDGMTEDLTTLISSIPTCFVIAPSTAFALRERPLDVPRVASRLGVAHVLEGSVSRAGSRVRLTARLHDGATGDELWMKQYDRQSEDDFAILSELAGTIADTMDPALGKDAIKPIGKGQTGNIEAWELCQRGRWHLHRGTKKDLDKALTLFQQASELETQLCRAWSGLAETYYQLVDQGLTDSAIDCCEAALKAVQLDPADAAARCALGKAHILKRQHEEAILEFEAALGLNANLASACHGLGAAYVFSGKLGDAIPYLERACRLSPCDQHMGDILERRADAHLLMRDHDQAVRLAEQALRHPPFGWSRHAVQISALGHLGRLDEARTVLGELLRHQPDFTLEFVRKTHLFAGQVALAYVSEPQLFTDQDEVAHYLDGLRKAGVTSGAVTSPSKSEQ